MTTDEAAQSTAAPSRAPRETGSCSVFVRRRSGEAKAVEAEEAGALVRGMFMLSLVHPRLHCTLRRPRTRPSSSAIRVHYLTLLIAVAEIRKVD